MKLRRAIERRTLLLEAISIVIIPLMPEHFFRASRVNIKELEGYYFDMIIFRGSL